jgi:hypothetical protein
MSLGELELDFDPRISGRVALMGPLLICTLTCAYLDIMPNAAGADPSSFSRPCTHSPC